EPRLMAELIETATGARKWLVEWPTELVPMEVGAATANAIVVGGILFTDRSVDVVQSFSRDDGSPRSEIITVFQVISGLPDGDVIIHADSGFSRRPANDLSTVLWTVPGERFDYLGSTKEILFTRGGAFRVSDGEEVSFQNYGGKF